MHLRKFISDFGQIAPPVAIHLPHQVFAFLTGSHNFKVYINPFLSMFSFLMFSGESKRNIGKKRVKTVD